VLGVVRHRAAQLAAQQRLQFLVDDGSSRRPQVIANHDLRLDVAAVVARLPEHLRVCRGLAVGADTSRDSAPYRKIALAGVPDDRGDLGGFRGSRRMVRCLSA